MLGNGCGQFLERGFIKRAPGLVGVGKNLIYLDVAKLAHTVILCRGWIKRLV